MHLGLPTQIVVAATAALHFTGATQLNGTVSIPPTTPFLLPPFFVGGNETTNFVDTKTGDSVTDALLAAARNASFIAYHPEFFSIFGPRPELTLLAETTEGNLFYEAGVWVHDRNEVWFSEDVESNDTLVTVVNLGTGEFHHPNTSQPVLVGNGGHYFDGKVYITTFGNATYAGGVVAIDPNTGETSTVLNSFFGLRFNGPDDITVIKRASSAYLFFTDPAFSNLLNYSPPAVMPDAVWRYDLENNDFQAVISRADILVATGVAANAEGTRLYVTDTPLDFTTKGYGQGGETSGSPAIFVYDIDADLRPVNKRLFGIARSGFPDGIHVDDAGRVWTGEGEGVVIRNCQGTVLGIVNTESFGEPKVTNFALAGDKLVIGGFTKAWSVKLAYPIVSSARYRR